MPINIEVLSIIALPSISLYQEHVVPEIIMNITLFFMKGYEK